MTTTLVQRLAHSADLFATRCAYEAALSVAANANNLDPAALRSGVDPNDVRHAKGAARRVSAARREAIYLTATIYDVSLRKIADAIGLSHEAVRKAIGRLEEDREDGTYDRKLDELELQLMGAA